MYAIWFSAVDIGACGAGWPERPDLGCDALHRLASEMRAHQRKAGQRSVTQCKIFSFTPRPAYWAVVVPGLCHHSAPSGVAIHPSTAAPSSLHGACLHSESYIIVSGILPVVCALMRVLISVSAVTIVGFGGHASRPDRTVPASRSCNNRRWIRAYDISSLPTASPVV